MFAKYDSYAFQADAPRLILSYAENVCKFFVGEGGSRLKRTPMHKKTDAA